MPAPAARSAAPLHVIAAALGAVVAGSPAHAQTEIGFVRLTGSPSAVAAAKCPPGETDRMFVLTLNGNIRILNLATGTFLEPPIVTIPTDGSSNGVTCLTFHPDFATSSYFYVWRGVSVARLQMTGDPRTSTSVMLSSMTPVIRIPTLAGQHVGGWIDFGFDGMLWISTGDAHNSANGQRTDNLMGRILRIDVDGPDNIPGNADDDGFPADPDRNYTIPPDNPFLGEHPGLDEIWAYGLRNPYRCSLDMMTGALWIGDVGGTRREEINYQPLHHLGLMPGQEGYHGGRNYGWTVWEGTFCNGGAAACAGTPQTPPIAEYNRGGTPLPPLNIQGGNVILGGYVYHGCSMPSLRGWYVFGDGGSPDFVWAVLQQDGVAVAARQLIRTAPTTIYGFAQDNRGEIYLCGAGGFYRIVPADLTGRDLNGNGIADSCEPFCGADFNADGVLDPDDLSDFIGAYFAVPPAAGADFNASGNIDADDLSDYITAFFGCG